MTAREEWRALCYEYGFHTMPMEIVRAYLEKWKHTISGDTIICILTEDVD